MVYQTAVKKKKKKKKDSHIGDYKIAVFIQIVIQYDLVK